MKRQTFFILGNLSLGLGLVGAFLPLLPTVPFVILAAFLFARADPALEQRLLDHRHFGPHIRSWRERGAISRRGKLCAILMLCGSAIGGLLLLDPPWSAVPAVIAFLSGSWIATRPTA